MVLKESRVLDKNERNRLLENGPAGAQNVELGPNNTLIYTNGADKKCLADETKQQRSGWLEFESARHLKGDWYQLDRVEGFHQLLNLATGQRSDRFKTKTDLDNDRYLLDDGEGLQQVFNLATGQRSGWLNVESFRINEHGEIVCVSKFGTEAIFDFETGRPGPYQEV